MTLAWVCLRISLRISNFCRLWSNRNAQTRPALAHMDKLLLAVVAIGLIVLIAAPRLNGPHFAFKLRDDFATHLGKVPEPTTPMTIR